jgi:hypothetical protein
MSAMTANTFQVAAARAASSYADGVWEALGVAEQCAAIYAELRELDRQSLAGLSPPPASASPKTDSNPMFANLRNAKKRAHQ